MTLFLIPARAGSKRLPGKNKRLFCGLPLYRWSLATFYRVSAPFDCLVFSTNDEDILHDSIEACPRPDHLCGDDVTTQALIDDAFRRHNDDTIVLLQPTSPTRPDSLVRMMIAHGGQVRSVTNGKPNGQCWVYRRNCSGWTDIETEPGFDIDVEADFIAAEKEMLKRFA